MRKPGKLSGTGDRWQATPEPAHAEVAALPYGWLRHSDGCCRSVARRATLCCSLPAGGPDSSAADRHKQRNLRFLCLSTSMKSHRSSLASFPQMRAFSSLFTVPRALGEVRCPMRAYNTTGFRQVARTRVAERTPASFAVAFRVPPTQRSQFLALFDTQETSVV